MANQFLSATWGSKTQQPIAFKTPSIAPPTATSNPRGIRAAVGKRPPIVATTIGMASATREDRFKKTPIASITPAIDAPTEEALGVSTRERALQLDRRLQSKIPLPTNLLNRKRPLVTYKELTNADQDLIDAEVTAAKPYKSGLESITSADIGELSVADRQIARQIKAFEVLAKTRPLTIAEREALNELKSEYVGNVAAVPAAIAERTAAVAGIAQRMSAEQKAIEDKLLEEASSYLQEKLGRERAVSSGAQKEAERIQARAEEAASMLVELQDNMRASAAEYRDVDDQIKGLEAEMRDIEVNLREDLPEEERDDLSAQYRALEATRERRLMERGRLSDELERINDHIQGQRELLGRVPMDKKRLEKEYKQRLAEARRSQITETFGKATQAYLEQPKKRSSPGQAAGEVELLLRKIVGPTAAYKLSRQLVTGDVDDEKEEEPEGDVEITDVYPIEYEVEAPPRRKSSAEAKAPSRKPSAEVEIVQDKKLNPAALTEAFIEDHDADEVHSVLKTLDARKRAIEDPPPGYKQTEEQRRKELKEVTAGKKVAEHQLEKLQEARARNTELAEALTDDDFRDKWIAIQLKAGKARAEDKQERLDLPDLKRMFLVLRSDFTNRVNRDDPPGFDVHRNKKKLKGGLPNASKEALTKYLANTIPKYYA